MFCRFIRTSILTRNKTRHVEHQRRVHVTQSSALLWFFSPWILLFFLSAVVWEEIISLYSLNGRKMVCHQEERICVGQGQTWKSSLYKVGIIKVVIPYHSSAHYFCCSYGFLFFFWSGLFVRWIGNFDLCLKKQLVYITSMLDHR